MAVISVLDKSVSELIAAGEVIERPSSVIKELVENSIDAGAKHITIEIKNGGTTFMRITDDGCGMSPEDVPTAFLRHATSKISEKEDLDTILTLGFRGEALASVSAVAKVTVMTKRKEDDFGTMYEIAGETHSELEECGCPDGTTFIVKDLFFNVPARKKFMKRESTEGTAVSQIIQKIAISHPDIAFRLIRDNKQDFHSDGSGSLYSAVYAVYGKDFAHDLMEVNHEENGIKVTGYAVKPLYSKNNRTYQAFFVNTRYVHSKTLSVALESAYENLVMTGRFPACVLFLEMSPDTLDVNIHPAKAEVRFSDEKKVIDAIYFAVKNAMLKAGLIYEFQMPKREWTSPPQPQYEQKPLIPEKSAPEPEQKAIIPEPVSTPEPQPEQKQLIPETVKPSEPRQPLPKEDMPFGLPAFLEQAPPPRKWDIPTVASEECIDIDASDDTEEFPDENLPEVSEPVINAPESLPIPRVAETIEEKPLPYPNLKVVGELFANYILAESGETFIIIDKHAAHERVIFERLRKANCKQYQQILLEPCEILLTLDEFAVMQENAERLDGMGFTFDFTNQPYVRTLSAPVFFAGMNLDEIVQEIAHNLMIGKVNPQSRALDDTLHELACKSAIRANDKNSISELQALADEVCNDENIRHCPHGRPVMFTVSKYNLEKQFRRRV